MTTQVSRKVVLLPESIGIPEAAKKHRLLWWQFGTYLAVDRPSNFRRPCLHILCLVPSVSALSALYYHYHEYHCYYYYCCYHYY